MPRIAPIPWDELKPEQRAMMQAGMDAGAYRIALPLQVLAYADHHAVPDDGDRHPNFPRHLLDGTRRRSGSPVAELQSELEICHRVPLLC